MSIASVATVNHVGAHPSESCSHPPMLPTENSLRMHQAAHFRAAGGGRSSGAATSEKNGPVHVGRSPGRTPGFARGFTEAPSGWVGGHIRGVEQGLGLLHQESQFPTKADLPFERRPPLYPRDFRVASSAPQEPGLSGRALHSQLPDRAAVIDTLMERDGPPKPRALPAANTRPGRLLSPWVLIAWGRGSGGPVTLQREKELRGARRSEML